MQCGDAWCWGTPQVFLPYTAVTHLDSASVTSSRSYTFTTVLPLVWVAFAFLLGIFIIPDSTSM